MRYYYFLILLVFSSSISFAQNTFPPAGNVGIGTTLPNGRLDVNGDILLPGSNNNTTSRPIIGALRITGEIAGYSANGINYDDGFLRLSAGGGTSPHVKSFIDLSGYSTLPDMRENITFGTGGMERMRIISSGYIGIGTSTPNYKVDIFKPGTGSALNIVGSAIGTRNDTGIDFSATNGTTVAYARMGLQISTGTLGQETGGLAFSTINGGVLSEKMFINGDGNVGIGTATPDSKLSVNGKIRAHEIKVEIANWPDYVFAKEYQLPSLAETEKHIKEKGHLQGIPSAKEAEANGIELGAMNAKLLKKIEELTLHLIEKDKELKEEKMTNKSQEIRLRKLELLINSN